MRTKASSWFEVKFAYDKQLESGNTKKVTELYVFEALSFGEAEKRTVEEMEHYVSGEYEIKAIAIPKYKEVWFSDNSSDDKFYMACLQFIIIDEKTGKEKKVNKFYLVQAESFDSAKKYIEETMKGSMCDYNIASLKETSVMDVFEREDK